MDEALARGPWSACAMKRWLAAPAWIARRLFPAPSCRISDRTTTPDRSLASISARSNSAWVAGFPPSRGRKWEAILRPIASSTPYTSIPETTPSSTTMCGRPVDGSASTRASARK
jgi:hypothetical protein